jgi:hypothetical protein
MSGRAGSAQPRDRPDRSVSEAIREHYPGSAGTPDASHRISA